MNTNSHEGCSVFASIRVLSWLKNIIAVLTLLSSLLPLHAADPLSTGIPSLRVPDAVGVNIHFTGAPKRDLDLIAAAGFGFVRMDFTWSGVERKRGEYDFRAYDQLLNGLSERKIRALFILDYGNPIYTGAPMNPPVTEEARTAFAKFCAAAVSHYKDFPNGRSIIWEIWNEPNISQFWKLNPNADDYAAMAIQACKAMREADPLCTIIGPATSEIDLKFLERVFEKGLLDHLDAVSVHPYRGSNPETVEREYSKLRALIAKYSTTKNAKGAKSIPIISGEWGYSTHASGKSREQQAQYLARQWLTNLANGIPLSIWYDWHDDGPDPKENEHNFGTVQYKDWQPKPSYLAAKTFIEQLRRHEFAKRIPQKSTDDYVLLFTRGKEQRLVAWTTGKEHEIVLECASLLPLFSELKIQQSASKLAHSKTEVTVASLMGETKPLPAEENQYKLTLTQNPQFLSWTGQNDRLALEAAWRVNVDNPLISAGVPAKDKDAPRFTVTVSNPFERTLQFVLRAKGENGWEKFASHQIKAKQTASYEWRGAMTRRDSDQLIVPVELQIDSPKFLLTNAVEFTVGNTVLLRAAPAADANGNLEVRVIASNPSGEPMKGELHWTVGHAVSRTAALVFKPGQQETTLPISTGLLLPRETSLRFDYWLSPPKEKKLMEADLVHNTIIRLVEVFDDNRSHQYRAQVDGDAKVAGKAVLTRGKSAGDNPPFPSAARIDYEFGDGWRFLLLAPKEPVAIADKPKSLGVWVHRLSVAQASLPVGDVIRCRFVDTTGQTFQPTAETKLDFAGWRYVTMALADTATMGHWGGANDGIIHYPIKFETLFLVDSVSRKAHKDAVCVTGFTLHY